MAPSLLSSCFHRAAGALFSVVKPACCDSLVLSIVGMAWRRLSRMRNDTRIDGRGCASGRWRATKVPRQHHVTPTLAANPSFPRY